jgi:hypothetical protein
VNCYLCVRTKSDKKGTKMKRVSLVLLFFVLSLSSLTAQQKYALVFGNGAYRNLTRLNNPVNDANDMRTALQGLGFNVDTVINGSRVQMEEAIERFRNRLSVSRNSYGFLFYAGHGVQSGGTNYLIPVDADIRSESYLGDRAVSVQAMLDEINQAGNELNVVVLDACRDNPFSWSRSSTRGLQVVNNQPADSIIVYATSAGATAADGTGRNGLFTSELLKNLKTPGLEVNEIFRRTGGDVARVSGGGQRPAVYNQFYGIAYLGSRPSAQSNTPVQPQPQIYKVGDIGPAGGIIFYDKGNNSGGWRYLEAAPAETDRVVDRFSYHSSYAEITDRTFGAGLMNTRIYLEKLRINGITGNTAPRVCDDLVFNGFDDWYLPSLDELLRMYTILRDNKNAGFQPLQYWTSTCYPRGEAYPGAAYFVNFSNGQTGLGYADNLRIRACRRF